MHGLRRGQPARGMVAHGSGWGLPCWLTRGNRKVAGGSRRREAGGGVSWLVGGSLKEKGRYGCYECLGFSSLEHNLSLFFWIYFFVCGSFGSVFSFMVYAWLLSPSFFFGMIRE